MDLLSDILSTYMDILRICSPPGKEKNLRQWIIGRLKSEGIPPDSVTEDLYGNLIINIKPAADPAAEKPEVIFTAHLDNYLKKNSPMTPYYSSGRIQNQSSPVLGGDDKTAVAAFLVFGIHLYRRSLSDGISFRPFRIIFTSHEENLTWKGWSWGARKLKSTFTETADIVIAMDVPSGKKIRQNHFFIYHIKDSSDPFLAAALEAAEDSGILNPFSESESEGFIGGDATTFYRQHHKKVIDFATGNFNEHTEAEYTDLRTYLRQSLWVLNYFYRLQGIRSRDTSEFETVLNMEDNQLDSFFKNLFYSGPAPVKEPPPAPVRPVPEKPPQPAPSPSPGRPAPVPGREPRPVTDPKNHPLYFIPEYYHTAPENLRMEFSGITPFASGYPDILMQSFWTDYMQTLNRLSSHHLLQKYPEKELPAVIKKIQAGHEDKITDLIRLYLAEIMGDCYTSVSGSLDIAWYNPYEKNTEKSPSFVKEWFRENTGSASDKKQTHDQVSTDYLKEVLIRTETSLLIIQGFSVIYMDGFFRMFRQELNSLHQELADIYELFNLYGRFNHFRTFEDVLSGIRLPPGTDSFMEKSQSQGRVWFSSDPVTDENTGEVIAMNNKAHARSESGVVLAHEALKGSIQLLLPWARFHESYLNDAEREILRKMTGSFWAEIRQFATGASFFRLLQKYLENDQLPDRISEPAFYQYIDGFSQMETAKLTDTIRKFTCSS